MAVGRIKSRAVGDLDEARKRNARGAGDFALTVKGDSDITVRFLDEPHEWVEFSQHYMEDMDPRAFPCNEGDCLGCDAGNQPSRKWAARVIDVADRKVRVFVMPKTVWEKLVFGQRRGYEAYGTILDRDYVILRKGSGKNDTEYDVDDEEPAPMRLKVFRDEINALDVDEWLENQVPTEEGSSNERSSKSTRGGSSTRRRKPGTTRTAPRPRRDEDDEEDDVPFDRSERRSSSTRRKPGSGRTGRRIPRR